MLGARILNVLLRAGQFVCAVVSPPFGSVAR
jgi:hypothetical protein